MNDRQNEATKTLEDALAMDAAQPADCPRDILLCAISRAAAILKGEPYYDYSVQAWVE